MTSNNMIFKDMTIEETLVNLLIERGWHISCAESCTGGLLTAAIVNVANASKVLDAGFITYANEAKVRYLGVSRKTIDTFGVVSEEVAAEMAAGAARAANAEVGVSVTGIAGPTGGSDEKPVGMVCFGFFINGQLQTAAKQFGAVGRSLVRAKSTAYALETLCRLLKYDEACSNESSYSMHD